MTDIESVALGHVNLRGNVGNRRFVDGVEDILGQPLPLSPNTMSQASHRIYWLGPDEWQIVTDRKMCPSLLGSLKERLRGEHVSMNDQSGGQVAYHLIGTAATDKLANGCTLDLHPSVFKTGHCAQGNLAKAGMLLGCIDTTPVYEIIVRRSFSEYVLRWLRQS